MNTTPPRPIGPDAAAGDVRALACRALRAQIRRLADRAKPTWTLPVIRDAFDAKLGRHFHLFPELFLQVQGRSIMRFPRQTLEIGAGGLLLVPRGLPHEEYIGDPRKVFRNLVFMYGERHVHVHIGYGRENDTQPRGRDTATMPWSPPDEPARYLNDIAEMFQQQAARTATAIRGLLLAHLVCLLRSVEAPPPTGAKESDKILQCRHLISQRLADPQLSVKTLAAWLACSADYLSHCYHRETGMHLSRFITMRRMEQAQTLLRNAAMNIAEVALSCGYRDAGHFTRVFRQFTGEPPRAWRRGVNP